ncbi:hypothetical protein Ancab_023244 [Ancistrocladus abbreviatus]
MHWQFWQTRVFVAPLLTKTPLFNEHSVSLAAMASSIIRACRRSLLSSFSPSSGLHYLTQSPLLYLHKDSSECLCQTRTHKSESGLQSPFDANIVRILRTEIEYQSEYAPPDQPVSHFNFFDIEDHPGEQWIRLKGKFEEKEDIKVEATMFDGCVSVPKPGDDTDWEDTHLHISLLVDISKGEGSEALEFVCSAWPNYLEIQKVYILQRDGLRPRAYMGPNFRELNAKLQNAFREYLEARGVTDELSAFLHEYMVNKDRIELIRWLGTVKSFVQH